MTRTYSPDWHALEAAAERGWLDQWARTMQQAPLYYDVIRDRPSPEAQRPETGAITT